MSATAQTLKQKLDATGLPQVTTATPPEAYKRTLDTTGLPALYGAQDLEGSRKAVTDALYQRQTAFLDPQYAQREQSLKTSLANKGVAEGSEAWRTLMDQFDSSRTLDYSTARNDAIASGLNEITGLSSIARQNRAQDFGERLSSGNFENQATASTNSDSRATTSLNNQASVQAMTEALGLKAIETADADRSQAAKNALLNGLFGLGSSAIQNTDLLSKLWSGAKGLLKPTDASGVPGDASAATNQMLDELLASNNTLDLGSGLLGGAAGGAAAAGGGGGAAAGGTVGALFDPVTGEIANSAAWSTAGGAGGAAGGSGGLLALGDGISPIGTGAIDAATSAGASNASGAIAAANGGSSAAGSAASAGTVASAAALGVIAPFVVGMMANAQKDLLPAPVQINDPRTGQTKWTQSKSELTTTINDIMAWNARQGNIPTPYDNTGDVDPDVMRQLYESVLGPNWQG